MHWLAVVFLVLRALDDIVRNLKDIIDSKYDSVIGKVFGSLLNAYAWYYVLSYTFSGLR